ncbi:MAG: Uma2 family endonuclease [Planctomycetota bacterium]|nr:Uma2 family endonuclease [Planctomycetota bacterium]
MSTATIEATPQTQAQPAWRPHRWTTAEFDSLLTGGFLVEGSKTFLWDGKIIDPMPENEPHANAQDKLCRFFMGRLPEEEWSIRPAHPLALRDGYKPQPDLVVIVCPRPDRRVPTASDAALVVEVSDSSYANDADEKLPQYARAGIPRYWIVNLIARRIEVYTHPAVTSDVGHYESRQDYPLEATVPLVLTRGGEDREFGVIAVRDVLRDSLEEM